MTHSYSPRGAYTRFIPSEEIGDVTQWHFGAVDGSDPPPAAEAETVADELPPPGIDEAEHQAAIEAARQDAFAQGKAQGEEETALAWQQRMDDYIAGQGQQVAAQLGQLVQSTDATLSELQQRMAQEVLELACDIARQVVRQELSVGPEALLPVVREALGMLVAEGRPATVRVNPADWSFLEQPLTAAYATAKVQWVPDAAVAEGDCFVESAGTVVDGSLDRRWRRAIAALGLSTAWKIDEGGHG
ncbi:FliH/SctL family protein [Acidovorax sp. NCPPB 4044]|uniref:FliH/SctL family protein n=1 Tax=Acidovorax sp. NCPPB 4044 TaxID=2940490 RepID=UPI0023037F70|nr:flagellar assembly protein FliH [Acidovorax sp. NCPPB 4044]MDA8519161.1 flagellar assembly protein FliH [Acidovorax sp. NCPPB 4044]